MGNKNMRPMKEPVQTEERVRATSIVRTEHLSGNANQWAYGSKDGPDTWWVHYPAAGGSHQSPIDISPEDAVFNQDLATYPLKVNYASSGPKLLKNTGFGCQVDILDRASYITGGPLGRNIYRLAQFHFHWGDQDDCGSEHLIHHKACAGELHLVHWNCTKYSSFQEASKEEDGLAVIGILLQLGRKNETLAYVTDVAPSVQFKGDSIRFHPTFTPAWLLPRDLNKYWVYHGSLTTPPCNESVVWIVMYDPISISSHQLQQFRHLCSYGRKDQKPNDEFDGFILKNYRPVQPVGHRKITTMEHIFTGVDDFDQQFHRQSLFTQHKEFECQANRQGLNPHK